MNELAKMQEPEGVRSVAAALAAISCDAVLVGGAVRDALLGMGSVDFDIVTQADTAEVRAALNDAQGVRSVYDIGERFGTIGAALDRGQRLEVTRYRPDALDEPTLERRFAVDSGHRDFTVNAIGLDLGSGALLDPQRGAQDLREGILRAPGVPRERIAEDPLRVVRAARFVSQLGLELEAATFEALPSGLTALRNVAVERVREELTRLLVGAHAAEGLAVLQRSGALAVVLPEVAALDGVTQPSFHDLDVLAHTIQAVSLAPPSPVIRWATLLHDVGKGPTRTVEADGRIRFFRHAQVGADLAEQVCRRLRFSNADTQAIVHLVSEHMRLGDVNFANPRSVDRAVRKLDLWVEGCDPPRRLVSAEDAVELTLADFAATAHRREAPALRRALEEALGESRDRGTRTADAPPMSGEEVMRALGLSEGPDVGVAMRAMADAVESGSVERDDHDELLKLAREALA